MQIEGTNSAQIQSVLTQMRALRAQAQQGVGPVQGSELDVAPTSAPQTQRTEFGSMLKGAIDQVNDLQQTSSQLSTSFLNGEERDLVKVMIAGQKASLGFQSVLQVRNRMVSAYQDIMNMPI